jgi:tagaturonate reductase
MTNRILQFGTSRFLQAHADLFVHQAHAQGQDVGPITVVKTTNSASRASRIEALNSAAGYPVRLRGFQNGQLLDETYQVTSVTRALDANTDWEKIKHTFAHETEIVISNVGETGYDLNVEDQVHPPRTPPQSFPAKLHALLLHRYEASGKPLLILPCELVSNNGRVLFKIINEISETHKDRDAFKNWLADQVLFCDTLVDRIVSEAIEPIGAIGEPYGLWAIKRQSGFVEPLQHPSIVYTDDLEPYLRLKLHILNLGHTFLAHIWKIEKRPADETVRLMLQNSDIKFRLTSLYQDEVIPGFSAQGMQAAATDYVRTTIERFENPFLNHRLSDIAQNHSHKIERRIVDFMEWVKLKNAAAQFKQLEALVAAYQVAKILVRS